MITPVVTTYDFEMVKEILNPKNDVFFGVILPQLDTLKLTFRNLKLTCRDLQVQFNDKQLLRALKLYFPSFSENIPEDPAKACREIYDRYDRYRMHSNMTKGLYAIQQIVGKQVNFEDLSILPEHELFVIRPENDDCLWNRTTKEYAILETSFVRVIGTKKLILESWNVRSTLDVFDRQTKNKFSIPSTEECTVGLEDEQFVIQNRDGTLIVWDLANKTSKNFNPCIPNNIGYTWKEMPIYNGYFYSTNTEYFDDIETCKKIFIQNLKTGEFLPPLMHESLVSFKIEKDFLYSYAVDKIYIWDLKNHQCIEKWVFDRFHTLAACQDGYLFMQSIDCNFKIIDSKTGQNIANINHINSGQVTRNLHFNGKDLILDQKDDTITILNFAASDMAIFKQIADRLELLTDAETAEHLLTNMPPQITASLQAKATELSKTDPSKTINQHLASVIRAHFSEQQTIR